MNEDEAADEWEEKTVEILPENNPWKRPAESPEMLETLRRRSLED